MRAASLSGLNPLQTAFDFVDPEARYAMTELWTQGTQLAADKLQKKDRRSLKRLVVMIERAENNGHSWSNIHRLLERPLGQYQASDLDIQPASDDLAAETRPTEKQEWSDQAMLELHEGLLLYSLQLLRSKGNGKEKLEVLEWIWAPDIESVAIQKVRGVYRQVPIRADQLPFTFQTCCRLSGYHYDDLRDGLAWEMRAVLKKLGFIANTKKANNEHKEAYPRQVQLGH
jgi:hypothetical protein